MSLLDVFRWYAGIDLLGIAARGETGTLASRSFGDINHATLSGYTPLMLAVLNFHEESAFYIINQFASLEVDRTTNEHNSALNFAAHTGQATIVLALLNRGADPNNANVYGKGPLFAAWDGWYNCRKRANTDPVACAGYEAAFFLLLRHPKIVVDMRDIDGSTLLLHAAYNDDDAAVRALSEKGADPRASNNHGNSAAKFHRQ